MIAKKGSALTSVSYAEALEAALRHGWIDGQKQAHDSEAWLQKFTPRGARSIWSKINREKAEQEGEDLLRNAEQRQPVRDPVQDSDREEGGDPRPSDRAIHRDAGEAREDPSMSGRHLAPAPG